MSNSKKKGSGDCSKYYFSLELDNEGLVYSVMSVCAAVCVVVAISQIRSCDRDNNKRAIETARITAKAELAEDQSIVKLIGQGYTPISARCALTSIPLSHICATGADDNEMPARPIQNEGSPIDD